MTIPPETPVLYTAIYGGKDVLVENHASLNGWRYVCFTDDPSLTSSVAEVRYFPPVSSDPTISAKFFKINPHVLFPDSSMSIWIDANIRIIDPSFVEQAETKLAKDNFALFAHKLRDCAYVEARACMAQGKENASLLKDQIKAYRADGLPEHAGLYWGGVLLRRHMDPKLIDLNNRWWLEILNRSRRDQISLSYLVWKLAFDVHAMSDFADRTIGNKLTVYPHTIEPSFESTRTAIYQLKISMHRLKDRLIASLTK